jgi:hypothetical protein
VTVVVLVVGLALTAAAVAWILFHRNEPETASRHTDRAVEDSTQWWGDTNDRPGDPGAESQAVPRPGEPGPMPDPRDP